MFEPGKDRAKILHDAGRVAAVEEPASGRAKVRVVGLDGRACRVELPRITERGQGRQGVDAGLGDRLRVADQIDEMRGGLLEVEPLHRGDGFLAKRVRTGKDLVENDRSGH